ncbi:SnoaL-like domain-containing protein (plasmid) [Phyllobacterium sp. 628]|nr:SnoaL-like domain-containing protein [Phyllobacterium sp. 628]
MSTKSVVNYFLHIVANRFSRSSCVCKSYQKENEMSAEQEKFVIQAVIEDWAKALGDMDAKRVLSHLTDDLVEFSLAPPLQFQGKNADNLQNWFDTWVGPIGNKSRDAKITCSENVAFARSLVRMMGTKASGEKVDLWFRQTLGLIRINGTWKICHTHESVPFYMDGSFKAAIDLKP